MRALPTYNTGFVGRISELDAINGALAERPVVSLVGTAGIGKTRLACEAAAQQRVPVLFIDASGASDADGVGLSLLRDLGADPELHRGLPPLAAAGRALSQSPVRLCLLDNLEQLGDQATVALSALRAAAPDVRWLATSQRAVEGAAVIEVGPLPIGDRTRGSVRLFLRAMPLGRQADADEPCVARIAERLEGVPLALELAAARAAVLPLSEIERRLDEPMRLLYDPSRPLDRKSALQASIRWSWDLLEPPVASALRDAAVFAGPFDEAAAVAVLGPSAPERLAVALERHLVRREDDGRTSLYHAVRAFVREEVGLERRAVAAHAEHFAAVAEAFGANQMPFAAFEQHMLDVSAVIEAARDESIGAARRAFVGSLRWYLVRQHPKRTAEVGARLLEAAGLDEACLHILNAVGSAQSSLGRFDEARTTAQRLVDLARQLGAPRAEVMGLYLLADVAHMNNRLDEAAEHAARLVVLARELDDRRALVHILCGQAMLPHMATGRFDLLCAQLDEALQIAPLVDPHTEARVRWCYAEVCVAMGRWADAREHMRLAHLVEPDPALRTAERKLTALYLESVLALAEGTPDAREVAKRALDRAPEAGRSETRVLLMLWVALAEALEGDGDLARRSLAHARQLCETAGAKRAQALLADIERLIAALLGDPDPGPPSDEKRTSTQLAALVARCAAGSLSPDEAEALGEAVGPRTSGWWVFRRVLRVVAERRRQLEATWTISGDGSWFAPPGAPPISLASQPTLARLAAALAAGQPLDLDAMFAAGWPGERATLGARRNRVRVAVTKLRQAGLDVAWSRAEGWRIAAPVRTAG